MASSDVNPPANETPRPRDGELIRLGRQVLPGTNEGQPLVMEFEARTATGQADEALALKQAAAIREVLAWMPATGNPNDDGRSPAGP
jgi:hypothetical protein